MSEVLEAPAPAVDNPAPVEPVTPATPATPEPKPIVEDWAPDWRVKISADPKHQKTLERFASPKALYESYESLRQKVSSGELKSNLPFPDKGTEAEQLAWRKQQGIPDKPEGYDLADVKLTDAQKKNAEWAKATAYELNIHPTQFKKFMAKQSERFAEENAKLEQETAQLRQQTEDAYRTEFGADYRTNFNRVANLLAARSPDQELTKELGEAMKVNPALGRFMVGLARELMPDHTVVASDGQALASSIDDRIAEIEKMMKTDRKAYNDPKISGPDGEYPRLIAAKARAQR